MNSLQLEKIMDHRYSAIDCDESQEPTNDDLLEFASYCDEMEAREREEDFEEANMELLAVGG